MSRIYGRRAVKNVARLTILMVILGTSSFSQQFTMSGPEFVKSGPFGRPILVMDDYGNWSIPISIYKDSEVETFVPDITRAGWVQWNVEQFRKTGTFSTRLYAFFKNDHVCRRVFIPAGHKSDPKYLEACANIRYRLSFITINTREKTVASLQAFFIMKDGSQQPLPGSPAMPIARLDARPRADLNRVSAIVEREMSEYKGMSAEEVVRQDAEVVQKMLKQTTTPDGQQGCPSATREQLQNWHNVGCPPVVSPAPGTKPH
jgi:hypothetical protein